VLDFRQRFDPVRYSNNAILDRLAIGSDELIPHKIRWSDENIRSLENPPDNLLTFSKVILKERRIAGSDVFALGVEAILAFRISAFRYNLSAAPEIREDQIILGAEQIVIVKRKNDLAALTLGYKREKQGVPAAEMLEMNNFIIAPAQEVREDGVQLFIDQIS
jgi:hypothetical protein